MSESFNGLSKKYGRDLRLWLLGLLVLCVLSMAGCGSLKKDGPGNPGRINDNYKDAVPRVDPLMSGPNKPYTVHGKRYVPDTREIAYRQTGGASWYGKQFHGRKTSSGEVYDMYAMTAAHKTLPIPCYVHVTNIKNGRSVIVRVNDRGPFSDKRLIDLSYAAAHRLGFVNEGVTDVIIERIMPADIRAGRIPPTTGNSRGGGASVPSTPAPSNDALTSGFYVQIGAYQLQENAYKMQNVLSSSDSSLASKLRVSQESGVYRVYAGPYATEGQAQNAAESIESQAGIKVLILDRR
ncbi:MAG: septal ring lytic transglycosylase RlpA family protein [Saezia sp.]